MALSFTGIRSCPPGLDLGNGQRYKPRVYLDTHGKNNHEMVAIEWSVGFDERESSRDLRIEFDGVGFMGPMGITHIGTVMNLLIP